MRSPTKATGGITSEEKAKMDKLVKFWTANAMKTDHINRAKIIEAIEGLYSVSGLNKPKVIIVPSPLVMAVAGGLSEAIIQLRDPATRNATFIATFNATRIATADAPVNATANAA